MPRGPASPIFDRFPSPAPPLKLARAALIAGAIIAVLGLVSPAVSLAAGIAVGLTLGNPWVAVTARASRLLLQVAVVGLGFGLALGEVWEIGRTGLLLTLVVVAAALAAGIALGRLLRVPPNTSRLVAVGTAICGGSAIAALAPILRAEDDEVAAALAAVFTLNAAGLFLFPKFGEILDLPPVVFGYWAALAIHDTSSVVAAGSLYGGGALAVATTVKLTRAAWLAPLALLWASRSGGGQGARIPWFIAGFVAAALIRTLVPHLAEFWTALAAAARHLLVLVLFLIGSGMTRSLLRAMGPRPLIQALLLWVLVAAGALIILLRIPLPA